MNVKKIIDTYKREEAIAWMVFHAKTSSLYVRPDSMHELNRPMLSTYKSRKAVYSINIRLIHEQLEEICKRLIKLGSDCKTVTTIEDIFLVLCAMNNTADRVKYYTTDHDGWNAYNSNHVEEVEKLIDNWSKKLSDALIHTTIETQQELKACNSQIEDLNGRIETLTKDRDALSAEVSMLKESLTAINAEMQDLQDLIEAKAAETTTRIEKNKKAIADLVYLIVEQETKISQNEKLLGDLIKLQSELRNKIASNKSRYDAAILHSQETENGIRRQIAEANEKLNKTVLFKRSKQAEIDQLQIAIQKRIDERAGIEKEFSTVHAEMSAKLCSCEDEIEKLLVIADLYKDKADELRALKAISENEKERSEQELLSLHDKLETLQKRKTTVERNIDSKRKQLVSISNKIDHSCIQLSSLKERLRHIKGTTIAEPDALAMPFPEYSKMPIIKKKDSSFLQSNVELMFERYCDLHAKLFELNEKTLYETARKQRYDALSAEGLQIEYANDQQTSIDSIKREIKRISLEMKKLVPYFGFGQTQEIADEKAKAFLKKVDRSFESFCKLLMDGSIISNEILPFPTIGHCIHTNKYGCYLWFNPLFALRLEMDKADHRKLLFDSVKVDVLKYSDISIEIGNDEIALDFGKACPKGATVVEEHWQYENVDGSKNLRYKNNQQYFIVAVSTMKLVLPEEIVTLYYDSKDDAESIRSRFLAHKKFLNDECPEVMEQFYASPDVPNIIEIFKRVTNAKVQQLKIQKEESRLLKTKQQEAIRKRESEKKKEEKRRADLENWAKMELTKKAIDEVITADRIDSVDQVEESILETWQASGNEAIDITNTTRCITTGIAKIEFIQNQTDNASKYLVLFTDQYGKRCSDVRVLDSKSAGTKTNMSLELKTKCLNTMKSAFLLIIDFDSGAVVNRIKYKVDVSFVNDFDF